MRTPRGWRERAVRLYRDGHNSVVIAAKLGPSVHAIAAHLKHTLPAEEYARRISENRQRSALTVVPKKVRDRQRAMVTLYQASLLSATQIATRFGVTTSTVSLLLRRHLSRADYARLKHEKHSLQMMGNQHGLGRKKTPAEMRKLRDRWGENNPNWKGAGAKKYSGHARAQRRFQMGDRRCARCPAIAQVRHHRDGNTHNNVSSNIEFLCRACHLRHHQAT